MEVSSGIAVGEKKKITNGPSLTETPCWLRWFRWLRWLLSPDLQMMSTDDVKQST